MKHFVCKERDYFTHGSGRHKNAFKNKRKHEQEEEEENDMEGLGRVMFRHLTCKEREFLYLGISNGKTLRPKNKKKQHE